MPGPFPEIPGFQLEGVLGAGPCGTVYRANQQGTRAAAVVQILPPDFFAAVPERDAFVANVQALSRNRHPNLARILSAGLVGECPFVATEQLPGRPLRGLLDGGGPLAPLKALELAVQLCRALDAAHELGVVHGDLHPGNVSLGSDGRVRVSGFGLALPVELPGAPPRRVRGTPGYLAPEVLRGDAPSPATDLHAAGAILYEALAGRPRYLAQSPEEALQQQLERKHAPLSTVAPEVEHEVESLVEHCLADDPAHRPASAAALAADLEGLLARLKAPEAAPPALAAPGPPALSPKAVALNQSVFIDIDPDQIAGSQRSLALFLGGAVGVLFSVALVWAVLRLLPKPEIHLVACSVTTTPTGATVVWKTDHACFSHATVEDMRPAQPPPQADATTFQAVFGGLSPATRYRARVFAGREPNPPPGQAKLLTEVPFTTHALLDESSVRVDADWNRALVNWRTTVPTDAVVAFGTTPLLGQWRSSDNSRPELDHVVILEGLEPLTSYHFQVCAGIPDLDTRTHRSLIRSFRTTARPPPPRPPEPDEHDAAQSFPQPAEEPMATPATPTTSENFHDRLALMTRWRTDYQLRHPEVAMPLPDAAEARHRRLALQNVARACFELDHDLRILGEMEKSYGRYLPPPGELLHLPTLPPHPVSLETASLSFSEGRRLMTEGMSYTDPADVGRSFSALEQAYGQFLVAQEGRYEPARTHLNLGRILYHAGEHLPAALSFLQSAEREAANEPGLLADVFVAMAGVHGLLGQSDDEIRCYAKALALRPNALAVHFRLSIAYDLARERRPEWSSRSFEHAKSAIRLDPSYKRRFRPLIQNSATARKVSSFLHQILEKSRAESLPDGDAEAYAKDLSRILGQDRGRPAGDSEPAPARGLHVQDEEVQDNPPEQSESGSPTAVPPEARPSPPQTETPR